MMLYVKDGRSFLGGLGLILAGAILTSLLQLYFAGEQADEGIVTSRWWWEVAMNLQVLALAFMWFCYVDRVSDSEGSKRRVMRIRMIMSLLIILLPFWVALLSAYLDWFEERPPIEAFDRLVLFMLFVWSMSVVVPRVLILMARPEGYEDATLLSVILPSSWYILTPLYVMTALWIFETANGGTLH